MSPNYFILRSDMESTLNNNGVNMKTFLKFISFLTFSFFSASIITFAHAGLIKETWDFRIYQTKGLYLEKSLNDRFSLDFIYDNESQEMHEYLSDGSTVKTCNSLLLSDCDNTFTHYSFMSDAIMSDISFLFDSEALNADGGQHYNYNQNHKSWRLQTTEISSASSPSERIAVVDSWYNVFITDYLPNHMIDVAEFTFHRQNEFGGYSSSRYKAVIENRSFTPVSVPEPPVFIIFSLGLLIVLSRRIIKKQH